jgi:alkanesulfonate monooxygenase SsuD/methylene tetrahydromethanopterin reductase-like flavin-dependent oxidoreductase (luciferase family)
MTRGVRIALMIEGQEGVTWEDWVALADTCERVGMEALFRSDHYGAVVADGAPGSLDAWGTINALAARTSDLRLGTLVSPSSFRHPSVLAKLVVTADHVSGGRVELGLGTGWNEGEHAAYGFPLKPMKERMDVLEEQLAIVQGHFAPGSVSFAGEHYALEGLDAQPKPLGKLPIVMGGGAGPRAARLAATYADEYNTVHPTLEQARERRAAIAAACAKAGREPIPFSAMLNPPDGPDTASLEEARSRLRELEAAGVERAFLQHLRHRDLATVEAIGRELVPALAS